MTVTISPPPEIVVAAVTMLSPYISGLSPTALLEALETYKSSTTSDKDARPLKPLTRKEAADALGISVQSVDRYLTAGRLTPVRYSARAVRVSAESVYNMMKGSEL